jgi:hypothetical protein
VYLSSLKQLLTKLPILKHVDNTLFMENFPLTYDVKDFMKCIYTIIAGISSFLAQLTAKEFVWQEILRKRMRWRELANARYRFFDLSLNFPQDANMAPSLTDRLLTIYEFLYCLRLDLQLHYQAPCHQIQGLQLFSSIELKSYKQKFLRPDGMNKTDTYSLRQLQLKLPPESGTTDQY